MQPSPKHAGECDAIPVRNMRDVIPVSMVRNATHDPPGPMKSSGINWYQINQRCIRERKCVALGTPYIYTLRCAPSPLEQPAPHLNPWRGIDDIGVWHIIAIYRNRSWAIGTTWFMWLLARIRLVCSLAYIRRNCTYLPPAHSGQWVGAVRERPYGEAWDDRDANSFCSLPRPRLVLFCECRSSADGAAVECVPRSGGGRKNKGAEDYERISFTISKG